jgi:hypothetical protein
MAEPSVALLERQSVQVKPDATKNPYGDGGFWSYVQTRTELISPWGTRQRELELRLWDRHPQMWIWQGGVAGLTKKVSSAPREIKGKNLVGYFDDVLRYANFGIGWDDFIAKGVRDFLRHDNGWYFEIIAPGKPQKAPTGRVTGIAHLDSLRCYPTGDPEYPVVYYDRDGQLHLMHHTRIVHIVDMPDGDESRPGYGLCALSRYMAIATQELFLNRYMQSMLDDKPQPGYVFWKGLSEQQRKNKFEAWRSQNNADDNLWGRVIHFESLDPANPVGAEQLTFSTAPEKFDYKVYTDLHVNAAALALGVDVQELWQLTGGNIGSGQQSEVLHAKSQGRTFGDLLTKLERELNSKVLPDTLEFGFKRHDPYEAQERAQTAQLWSGFTSSITQESTPEERRRILANMVEAFKDAVTDEKGEIIRLPDQDVKPIEEQEQVIEDGTPPEEAANPNTQEQTIDDSKAVKSIQATRLDFEADFADFISARRKGDMSSRRGDIIVRALLAKYIPRAYADGLTENGVDEMDDDDSAESLSLVAKASGYVTDFNSDIEIISEAEAALKPTLWWNKSILPAYDAGRYSADKNGLYEFVGDDGEESCPTCKRLKGQVHRMRDWTRKKMRPGVDTETYECKGFQCAHKLTKTSGKAVGSF